MGTGALTQLVECDLCKVEVRGSSPLCSTLFVVYSYNHHLLPMAALRIAMKAEYNFLWLGSEHRGYCQLTVMRANIAMRV